VEGPHRIPVEHLRAIFMLPFPRHACQSFYVTCAKRSRDYPTDLGARMNLVRGSEVPDISDQHRVHPTHGENGGSRPYML